MKGERDGPGPSSAGGGGRPGGDRPPKHPHQQKPPHGGGGGVDDDGKEKAKRGYRACLHCRARKAKCDLGDIDAPSKPPCSRCRRESRECVFAPSRRGGNNKRRRDGSAEMALEVYPPTNASSSTTGPPSAPPNPGSAGSFQQSPNMATRYTQHVDVLNPSPKAAADYSLFNHPSVSSTGLSPSTGTSGRSPGSSSARPQQSSAAPPPAPPPQNEKRRRLHLNPLNPPHKSDPSSIVVADMQNEADALHILALASAGRPSSSHSTEGPNTRRPLKRENDRATPNRPAATMDEFALVRLGILDEEQVMMLVHAFFRFHHSLIPMVPANRIPQTPAQVAQFARDERYFATAMIIVASRSNPSPNMRPIHERSWQVMRGWISDVMCLGVPPTVDLVEALLLLAENLPRDPRRVDSGSSSPSTVARGFGDEVHGAENNQAWMLIGLAIRCAYSLGIDKLGLKILTETDRTYEVERARLAWTYCYLFDRHVSLRLGRAFWSRGPVICFQGFSASAQTGPPAAPGNFPLLTEMRAPEGAGPGYPEQEDLASIVQTYLELTQLMSNAHDVLYPNAARTRALVLYGEYFKYIDELARSLDGFKALWREKKWAFPLTDAVWSMFYYTQLYICAFSFQAHVERAAMRAEEEYRENPSAPRPAISLFPRGAAASPDARYIFQSIDAARQLLAICVDSLHPGGALPYLPNRFLLWFTYAAIVLLKALYSGAMLRADHAETHKLIDRLCTCFAEVSPTDADHPAVRYGLQLQALRTKLASIATSANSPTGGGTVPLPPTDDGTQREQAWGPRDRPRTNDRDREHERERGHNGRGNGDPRGPPGAGAGTGAGDDADVAWSFPAANAPASSTTPITFPYASTPGFPPYGSFGVAPPHEQPLSEISSLHLGVDQNLGFATLDDWFPSGAGGSNGANSSTMGGGSGGGGNGDGMAPVGPAGNLFEALPLDLSDFWMKVGPGEAQGGFPFR